jgi:hypothetical protein
MAAGHMAVITSAIAVLFMNGFVGFQWVEDGTWISVWIFRILALIVFGAMYFIALATFKGIAGMSPSNSMVLYIIFLIFNPAMILLYFVLQLVLVIFSLEDRWPIGDLLFGAFFFVSGIAVLLVFSNQLCHLASHYIDGMFLGSLFILLAVMMVYKYWDSITAEDMEFCVGGAPHIWHLSNTMELSGSKELPAPGNAHSVSSSKLSKSKGDLYK